MTQLHTYGWVLTDIAGEHIFNIDSNTFTPVEDYDTRKFRSLEAGNADAIIRDNEARGCHLKREDYKEVFSQEQLRDITLQCSECLEHTPILSGYYYYPYSNKSISARVCKRCYDEILDEIRNEYKSNE
tara:strand:+ start:584 stop:970 length:387 start_codon:yes stop_codon:yes gene_type:complete